MCLNFAFYNLVFSCNAAIVIYSNPLICKIMMNAFFFLGVKCTLRNLICQVLIENNLNKIKFRYKFNG